MSRHRSTCAVLLLGAAVVVGCDQRTMTQPDSQPVPPGAVRALQPTALEDPCGTVVIVALRDAAQEPMGEALIWNGPTRAYVRFTAPEGWEVTEVRVEGKYTPAQFPRTDGVVDPSLFRFGGLLEPAQPGAVVEGLHLDNQYGVVVGDEVVIAAFARLRPIGGGAEVEVWAEGTPFVPGEHAMHLPYALQPCVANLSMVSAGANHTCGLAPSGAAYCWGSSGFGALGAGPKSQSRVPAAVLGGLSFVTISAGALHTCGIATDGRAYCWGANSWGQLGDGTTTNRNTPTAVLGDLTFTSVSASINSDYPLFRSHTCGIATDGRAYCWGGNASGQVGDDSTTDRLVPTAVAGELGFAAISAGGAHTCAVAMDGRGYCWGQNARGQLGNGTQTLRRVPTAVVGGLVFVAISAGSYHTCGIAIPSRVYCWGSNDQGRLGDGTTLDRLVPTVVGGLNVSSITAGLYHTCGVAISGTSYCWGGNHRGQIGDGTTTDRLVPTPIAGGFGFATLAPGAEHTCGIAMDERAYCWGGNLYGQLGDGTTTHRLVPTAVSGIGVVRSP